MNGIHVVLKDGGEFLITEEQIKYWQMIYPNLVVRDEITYLKEMWTVGAVPRKTAKNISKFINKFLYDQNSEQF